MNLQAVMMTDVARGLRADLNSFRVAIDRARLIFALALDFPSHTSNLYCAVLVHSALKVVPFQDFPVGDFCWRRSDHTCL